jgi:hypothetical protein
MNYDRRYDDGRGGGIVPYSMFQTLEGKLDALLERVNKAATRDEMTALSKDLMQRFDTMEQRFVPRDVYEAEKKLAVAQTETLKAETASQMARLSNDLANQETRLRTERVEALKPVQEAIMELRGRGAHILNNWVSMSFIVGAIATVVSLAIGLIGHISFH